MTERASFQGSSRVPLDSASVHERFLWGLRWQASTRVIAQLLSWASTIFVARLLVPEDYGLVEISGAVTGPVLAIAGLGIAAAIVQRDEVDERDAAASFWILASVALALYLILVVASPLIGRLYDSPDIAALLMCAGLAVPLSNIAAVPMALLSREMSFRHLAITSMLSQLSVTATVLPMALLGFGPWALILSPVVGQGVVVLRHCGTLKRLVTVAPRFHTQIPLLRSGIWLWLSRAMLPMAEAPVTLICSLLLGKAATGEMGMARTIGSMPVGKIGEIFQRVLFSTTARSKENRTALGVLITRAHTGAILLAVPTLLGMAATADNLIPLILGDQWRESTSLLQIFCFTGILGVSSLVLLRSVEGSAQIGVALRFGGVSLLLSPLGAMGGALIAGNAQGLVTGLALTLPVPYVYLLRAVLKLASIDAGQILLPMAKAAVGGLLMFALVTSLPNVFSHGSTLETLVAQVILGVLIYSVSVPILFGPRFSAHIARMALGR